MALPHRSPPALSKLGHGLAKVLRIKFDYRNPTGEDLSRGESVYSVSSADTFVEEEPTVWDWFNDVFPNLQTLRRYVYNLFPFIHWIGRYNVIWLAGDMVAGLLSARPIYFHYGRLTHPPKALRWALLSSLNPWRTPSWLRFLLSLGSTRHLWVS